MSLWDKPSSFWGHPLAVGMPALYYKNGSAIYAMHAPEVCMIREVVDNPQELRYRGRDSSHRYRYDIELPDGTTKRVGWSCLSGIGSEGHQHEIQRHLKRIAKSNEMLLLHVKAVKIQTGEEDFGPLKPPKPKYSRRKHREADRVEV